jgi:hypothetical protein
MTTAPTITFVEEGHKYFVDGREVISATQAINEGGFGDWRKFVDQMQLAHAQALGTAVHSAIELYEEGTLDTAALDPLIAPRLEAYEKFKRECDAVPVSLEQRVYNSLYNYCGRLDFNGLVRDEKAIVDWKSGVISHTVAMQLAAYAACQADPSSYARYSLQLRDDGTYRLHEYRRAEYRRDFNVFVSALNVAKFKRERGIS